MNGTFFEFLKIQFLLLFNRIVFKKTLLWSKKFEYKGFTYRFLFSSPEDSWDSKIIVSSPRRVSMGNGFFGLSWAFGQPAFFIDNLSSSYISSSTQDTLSTNQYLIEAHRRAVHYIDKLESLENLIDNDGLLLAAMVGADDSAKEEA